MDRAAGAAADSQRYACSLDQLKDFLDGRQLPEIDGRLVAEIIRARAADGGAMPPSGGTSSPCRA